MVELGLMLVPMGYVNEYHEPPVFYGVERPQIDHDLVPTTWRELGIGVTGKFDNISLRYQAYIFNGFISYKDGEGTSSLVFCDDEEGNNPVEVIIEEGDAIIFSGSYDFDGKWHYRPKVEQKSITQAFLHYVSPGNNPEYLFPKPIHRD